MFLTLVSGDSKINPQGGYDVNWSIPYSPPNSLITTVVVGLDRKFHLNVSRLKQSGVDIKRAFMLS